MGGKLRENDSVWPVGRSFKYLLGFSCASLALLALGSSAEYAAAQTALSERQVSRSIAFSIPPQELGGALNAFADRAGLRLLFPSNLVSGRQSAGLAGSFTREQALSRLLAGTGLTYRFTNANTVTIADPATVAGGAVPAGVIRPAILTP